MTLVLSSVSSGIIFFAKHMRNVGFISGPLLCTLLAFVCVQAGCLVADSCSMAERAGMEIISYEDLARFVGGAKMEKVLMFTKNFAFLGFIIAFMGVVSTNLELFFPQPVTK